MSDGCCKNKTQLIKIKDSYAVTKIFDVKTAGFVIAGFHPLESECALSPKTIQAQSFNYNNSPPGSSVQLFIFDRSLLI